MAESAYSLFRLPGYRECDTRGCQEPTAHGTCAVCRDAARPSYGQCAYCPNYTYHDLTDGACADCLAHWGRYPQTCPAAMRHLIT
jgi:hypothetical protein